MITLHTYHSLKIISAQYKIYFAISFLSPYTMNGIAPCFLSFSEPLPAFPDAKIRVSKWSGCYETLQDESGKNWKWNDWALATLRGKTNDKKKSTQHYVTQAYGFLFFLVDCMSKDLFHILVLMLYYQYCLFLTLIQLNCGSFIHLLLTFLVYVYGPLSWAHQALLA